MNYQNIAIRILNLDIVAARETTLDNVVEELKQKPIDIIVYLLELLEQ